jgi:hypothetical protein
MPRRVDGNNVLYHYIQKVILPRDDDFSRELVRRLILDLSIWLPVELYRAAPVLLPYCVRDASIKSKEWGSPNQEGYLRDNNSILKFLVSSYSIRSPLVKVYVRHGRGRNFTASHCWRKIEIGGESQYATTHPQTYSFIPNLAWLPAQVAKLTDHEGSYAQQLLQAVSHRLYRAEARRHPAEIAAIWESLPEPSVDVDIDLDRLNFFEVSARSVKMRRNILLREIDLILRTLEGGRAAGKSPRSARYLPALANLPSEQTDGLARWLRLYEQYLAGPAAD